MINITDITGIECWINPNYIVTTKEESYTPTNEFGIKQDTIHCWIMKMVNGDEIRINNEQMKALTEPIKNEGEEEEEDALNMIEKGWDTDGN